MKINRLICMVFLLMVLILPQASAKKNVLQQILGVYQKYQEINMSLWLVGDVGAEKRFGKELQMWMSLTQKEEKNPAIKNYVRSIFDRLVPHFNNRGMKFTIQVVRDSTANAFVIPGGHVYVNTGLLDFIKSDDELAAIISHELAHAERRHSLANFRASTVAVAILNKAVKNKKDRETWGALLGYLTLMKFSRQQEDEADDIGQFRMAAAGFNPAAQVSLWEKFLSKFGDSKGMQQYLSSHPPSSDRVQNARNNLLKMNVAEQQVFSSSRSILKNDRVNLLNNASFEAELLPTGQMAGWEISEGRAALAEAHAFTGRRSLQMTSEQRMGVTRVLSDFIAVNEATDMNFSAWCRSENGQQNVAVGIELYDASRRLRNRIWAVRESSPVAPVWARIEGRLGNSPEKKIFSGNTAFMRIVLQTGLMSQGSIWFDELRLRPAGTVDPINLLVGGDFESLAANGFPEGVGADKQFAALDFSKANTGYASLRLQSAGTVESGFVFAPIALATLQGGQEVTCSFYFQGDSPQKGLVIVELVDENGNPLPRRLAQCEFAAIAGNWQATSFSFKNELQNEEAVKARAIQVRVVASLSAGASIWFDTFVMR